MPDSTKPLLEPILTWSSNVFYGIHLRANSWEILPKFLCYLYSEIVLLKMTFTSPRAQWVNSSPPGENGCQFAEDIFKCIFMNEKICILIEISIKFVHKGPSIGLDNGLVLNRCQSIIWTNADPIHWRIYAALGLNELSVLSDQLAIKPVTLVSWLCSYQSWKPITPWHLIHEDIISWELFSHYCPCVWRNHLGPGLLSITHVKFHVS